METKTFSVSGMMCEHCKANVERALKAIDGVDNASVSLANKNVTVDYDASLVSTGSNEICGCREWQLRNVRVICSNICNQFTRTIISNRDVKGLTRVCDSN